MESAVLLEAVYKKIYGKDLNFFDFDDRLQIQKTTYLLQELGLHIGEYGFRWYKRGPYSQAVHDDAFFVSSKIEYIKKEAEKVQFGERAAKIVEKIKSVIAANPAPYSLPLWLEAVASIHYLKKYEKIGDDKVVLEKLASEKQHLKDDASNRLALQIANEIA